jgi:bifunctional DNA-binding transcriptional regulator/antitoxin component of YhaV-PrlF toxin-antitoxin module
VPKAIRRVVKLGVGDTLIWQVKEGKITLSLRRVKSLQNISSLISRGGNAVDSKKKIQEGRAP